MVSAEPAFATVKLRFRLRAIWDGCIVSRTSATWPAIDGVMPGTAFQVPSAPRSLAVVERGPTVTSHHTYVSKLAPAASVVRLIALLRDLPVNRRR